MSETNNELNEEKETSETVENNNDGVKEDSLGNVRDRVKNYYTRGTERAKETTEKDVNERGENFTAHDFEHAETVKEYSDKVKTSLKDSPYSLSRKEGDGKIGIDLNNDDRVRQTAAYYHDVGMDGEGYAIDKEGNAVSCDKENFSDVRKNHSLNSATRVLEDREFLKNEGFTDKEVDAIALECFAHSKSCSGVNDLSSEKQWDASIDKLSSVKDAYNEDHPDKPIEFDENIKSDKEALSRIAGDTLCLRVADASRPSGRLDRSQSGDTVVVDEQRLNNVYIDRNGDKKYGSEYEVMDTKSVHLEGKERMDNDESRKRHAGEQNVESHDWDTKDGLLQQNIRIRDADQAPESTMLAIDEIAREYETAGAVVDFNIDFSYNPTEDNKKEWEYLRGKFESNHCIDIHFPWDK